MASRLDFIQRANSAYIEQQYERYRRDPASVPEDWALFFAGFDLAVDPARPQGGARESAGTFGLVNAYRQFGHRIARLDPLGDNSDTHPLLELDAFGLSASDLDREVDPQPFHGPTGPRLGDLVAALRETYCGTLGVEYMNIPDPERRAWLEQKMESAHNHAALTPADRRRLLEQMLTADAFEQFLHVRFPGQKRFSLEGAATLVPMLNVLIERAAAMGVLQVVFGMPHRGRLNVLANVIGKPLEAIFSEFESSFAPEDVTGHGDVKYHLGYSSHWDAPSGQRVHLDLNFNPSHLEFVNPVVLGAVRARQDFMRDASRSGGIPVLVHGDAAFSGEGIVAETLALAQLPPYQTGGTLHIIVNNQIGFTTSPADVRVTRYPTDIAGVIEAPVFHVNGDDPEAAIHALTLALEYRATFGRDVFVDLVCYRLHGHNELDDPTFTQPVLYQKIAAHVPASRAYAAQLEADGVVSAAEREGIEARIAERLSAAHTRAREPGRSNGEEAPGGLWKGLDWGGSDASADTRSPATTLRAIAKAAARVPDAFHLHPKVAKLLEERVRMLEEDRIDWGCAEVLALGSLLSEGRRIRMSGQDTGRGTFSHRHAVLRDIESGERYVPLSHLTPDQGTFEIFDTLLSEAAALGFEYGYSTADPHALVVWEAQFGDFANVAQVYIDQFLASAESKWRRMSGLTLLLPHGYEGQGPEHSSARLERFLELCADGNLQVCNLTTPAQLFHALRRQLHRSFRKPLVIMSPKSLLRHRLAVSPLDEFTDGTFHSTLDDATLSRPETVERVLLVSGKFYYTLLSAREKLAPAQRERIAIARVEQLYPFPHAELAAILARYGSARDIRWVQEEPANMGGWRHLRHRLEAVVPERAVLTEITRRAAPTPATGWYPKHVEQENALVDEALRFAEARDTSRPGSTRAPREGLGAAAARRRP